MHDGLHINRRQLLKLGTAASLALGTIGAAATLSGCSPSRPAQEYLVLRDIDLPMLAALYPALIGPHPALLANPGLIQNALRQLDETLAHTSPDIQKQVRDILDLLTFAPSRGLLTGIWSSWDQADPGRIDDFLQRWRDSRLELLRACYKILGQLLQMSWYALPPSWEAAGYPGPPTI
ncbi:twin-arginine translocation pathway signal protein [Pseudomonas sp.]|uniref:twin-arginine translocation pathway signal protein n=1 Tax=Pseudomonas sp. TaxID=306 RepID=UPI00272D92B9|nr:twin-arginine translocation pathway signal protein [Pseudomonas sp.]